GKHWSNVYDNANHLLDAKVYDAGNNLQHEIIFTYDAFGNRIKKEVDPAPVGPSVLIQRYALDGWNPAKSGPVGLENFDVWADLGEDGSLTTRYVRGDVVDQLFARVDAVDHAAYWY